MERLDITKRVLSVFLAAAFAVSTAGCTKKDDNKKTTKLNSARKIENYFVPKELDMPEGMDYVENIRYSNDKIYLTGYKNGGEGENISKILDIENKTMSDIKLNAAVSYIMSACMTEDKIYVSYANSESSQFLSVFDRTTGEETAKTELSMDQYISSVFLNEQGNLCAVKIEYQMMNSKVSLQIYDKALNIMEDIDLTEKLGLSKNSTISSVISDKEGGYYAVSMDYSSESGSPSVYKLSSELDVIYTADDMDDAGYVSQCFIAPNGNLILSSIDKFSSGLMMFNEISSQDGSTVGRYEIPDAQMCYGTAGGYDVVYADESSIYGYKFENEESAKLFDFSDEFDSSFMYSTTSFYGSSLFMNTTTYGNDNGQTIEIMDLDGSISKEINLNENVSNSGYVNLTTLGSDGRLYALETVSNSVKDEETGDYTQDNDYSVLVYDENGDFSESVDLDDLDLDSEAYIEKMVVKDDGTLLLESQTYGEDGAKANISVVDADGKLKATIDAGESNYINNVITTADADYVMSYDDEMKIQPIDYENNKLGESIEMDNAAIGNGGELYEGAGSYDFYFSNEDAVYGYSVKDKKHTEIINWVDSDISISVQGFYPVDDNTIVCSAFDRQDGSSKVYILNRVDEETLKQIQSRQIITAAGIDITYGSVIDTITKFNKENPDYRIQITDYSKFSSYKDDKYVSGVNNLNTDIISGDIPDIIIGNYETDMESYIAKGLLTDLNTFIDNDKDIKKEDYYTNIFDMYTTDNKLYQLVPQFGIQTIVGKASELGEDPGWTIDEFLKFADSKSGKSIFYKTTYEDLLYTLVKENLSEFVDFKAKTCNFDNETFISLLEFIKKDGIKEDKEIEAKEKYDESDNASRFKDNKCYAEILKTGGFEDFNSLQQGSIREAAVLKGIPTSEGNGTLIIPVVTVGISEKSDKKEAAWSFVKNFLMDDYQNPTEDNYTSGSFPLKKSAMDKTIKNAQISDNGSSYTIGSDGEEIEIKPIDTESAQKLVGLISDSTRHSVIDSKINDIIDEQFNTFLEDGTTAQEAAKAIQSKAALYLKEIS
ncbi:MAG: extracellular solute-binding protein [Oscillospiraceae bacterium]|nr:extracellular solute-binding protein [Oscillospiraceae bacterium]